METNQDSGTLLSQVLRRSVYTNCLGRHVHRIGVSVDEEQFVFTIYDGRATLSSQEPKDRVSEKPNFWVECTHTSLQLAIDRECSVEIVSIRTGDLGQVVHPSVERLLLRCFEVPPFPLNDREDLIYPSLFGFDPAGVLLWKSSRNLFYVFQFEHFCVSLGLSEPWIRTPTSLYKEGVSGAGYELLIKSSDPRICSELVGWVQYLEQGGEDILPGNWLEFENNKVIPGTDVAGFLVVRPHEFPIQFPVGDSHAYWHQLVPVSASQLEAAKRTDVFKVAQSIGY